MAQIGEVGVRSALLERLLGLAAVQARVPQEALPHFDESIRLARTLGAEYELGRTLHAKTVTGFASDEDGRGGGDHRAARRRLVPVRAAPLGVSS